MGSRPARQKRGAPAKPLTNAERQRRFRERRDARLRELEEALRNEDTVGPGAPLRNAPLRNAPAGRGVSPLRNAKTKPDPGEELDDYLVRLRQCGDQLVADYVSLLTSPGLTTTESTAIDARFAKWRQQFQAKVKGSPTRREMQGRRPR